jgi:uncharacterized membrane protein HdeD (DUF308 family)
MQLVSNNWWLFVLRGVLAILIGVVALLNPGLVLAALVTLFGAFAFSEGMLSLIGCFAFSRTRIVGWFLLEGLAGIAVGVLIFARPEEAGLLLLDILGAWLIVSGALRLLIAYELRNVIRNERLVAMSGMCAVIAGVLTLLNPTQSAAVWMWTLGAYAIALGLLMLTVGYSLRKLRRTDSTATAEARLQ